jgi:plastocyanin
VLGRRRLRLGSSRGQRQGDAARGEEILRQQSTLFQHRWQGGDAQGDFSGVTNKARAEIVMGQQGFQFEVSALPIQVGTKVTFPNRDDAYHNVFSYSKTKRFDLGRYLKDETTPAVIFDKPGIVRLYCEIHEHMSATIVVVDSPYFTTPDTEGKFSLSGVPAGKHTLKAWLGKKAIVEKIVDLKDGETLSVDLFGK